MKSLHTLGSHYPTKKVINQNNQLIVQVSNNYLLSKKYSDQPIESVFNQSINRAIEPTCNYVINQSNSF